MSKKDLVGENQPEEETVTTKIAVRRKLPGILGRDFNDIDDALAGPGAWEEGRVAKIHPIAPPQGNPFLQLSRPLRETLKHFSSIYRR